MTQPILDRIRAKYDAAVYVDDEYTTAYTVAEPVFDATLSALGEAMKALDDGCFALHAFAPDDSKELQALQNELSASLTKINETLEAVLNAK
jgi:hypothetical protein